MGRISICGGPLVENHCYRAYRACKPLLSASQLYTRWPRPLVPTPLPHRAGFWLHPLSEHAWQSSSPAPGPLPLLLAGHCGLPASLPVRPSPARASSERQ
ncbi:hypothetical protein DPEC_G00287070 [Dallia pectoralis]|uniref:Uncharacterized protein n=1 Tax=Dallia pectoralis TaxID=75939 RepID=A0ACC2FKJ0_DALPE|nr:hypothetical protein DPEC_G00287070 [Dallia pectoralis]